MLGTTFVVPDKAEERIAPPAHNDNRLSAIKLRGMRSVNDGKSFALDAVSKQLSSLTSRGLLHHIPDRSLALFSPQLGYQLAKKKGENFFFYNS
jgi:hypothetical protein